MKHLLKRDWILTKRGVLPALVLMLLLAAVCTAAGFAVLKGAGEGREPSVVALVDEEDSLVSRMCIRMVREQEYISALLSVEKTDEDEAMEGLENGLYAAVLILPENFTSEIMTGREGQGRIILSEAAAASADIVAEVAKFGQLLLAAGQYGVFAGEHLIWDHELGDDYHEKFLLRSNTALLDLAMGAYSDCFRVETLPYAGTALSLTAHYVLCWLLLFLLLSSVFFTDLYCTDTHRGMLDRLFSLGVSPHAFCCGKILYPLLFRILLGLPMIILIHKVTPLSVSISGLCLAFSAFVLMSIMTGSFAVFCTGLRGFRALLLLPPLLGLLLGGGLIPRAMLPGAITACGDYLPSGCLRRLLSPLFGGEASPAIIFSALLPALLYAAVLYLAAVKSLRRKPLQGAEA